MLFNRGVMEHLSLRYFGAPMSRLHLSLLRPCHLIWSVLLPPVWYCQIGYIVACCITAAAFKL